MNLRRPEILVFLALGIGVLVWLLVTGSKKDPEVVDRHTGERLTITADVQIQARATGAADGAIAVLQRYRAQVADPENIDKWVAVLRADMSQPAAEPPQNHPERDAIRSDLEDRTKALATIEERLGQTLPAREIFMLLERAAADQTIETSARTFWTGEGLEKAPAEAVDAAAARKARGASSALEARAVALRYMNAGRMRCWLRWLRRAFVAGPDDIRNVQPLAAALIAAERQKEAMLVLGAAEAPDDVILLRLRAQVATWLGKMRIEADALERLIAVEDNDERRTRLIELLRVLGRLPAALGHARVLAERDPTRRRIDQAVNLALEAGMIDAALEMLDKATGSEEDRRFWLERLAAIAINDLQYDRAIPALEGLLRVAPEGSFPDGGMTYDKQLAWLYDKRKLDAKLLDHLLARLKRGVAEEARRPLEDEIVYFAERLKRADDVRAIFAARLAAVGDAKTYLAEYWDLRFAKVDGLVEKGLTLLVEPDVKTDTAVALYQALEKEIPKANRRALIEKLLEIHPDAIQFEQRYRFILDEEDPILSASRLEAQVKKRPDDVALTRQWVLRTSWIKDIPQQIRARETLRGLEPNDVANRFQLADLYEAQRMQPEALVEWRWLTALDDPDVNVEERLLISLMANELYEEALPLARARAERDGATDADEVRFLRVLVSVKEVDEALPLAEARAERPAATDEDRDLLLDLQLAAGKLEDALPALRKRAGTSRDDEKTLIGALQALEMTDEVLSILKKRAEAEDAPWDDRVAFADALLVYERPKEARALFEELARERPDDRHVLRRVAQARSWTGDARGAVAPARRWLGLPQEDETPEHERQRGELHFILGEAYWAMQRKEDARAEFEETANRFTAIDDPTDAERAMLARSLARIGRADEAEGLFNDLIAARPDNAALRLDAVDAHIAAEQMKEARKELEHARPLAGGLTRFHRLDGTLHLAARQYERAIPPLEKVAEKAPDASVYADLGQSYRNVGCWRAAIRAWCQAHALKPDRDTAEAIEQTRFELGPVVKTWGRWAFAGNDDVWRAGAHARVPLRNDRWSIAVLQEWARFEGPAEIVAFGIVSDTVGIVDVSARKRFGRWHYAEGGVTGYIDRARGRSISGWAAARFERRFGDKGFHRWVRVEAWIDRMLEQPAAAVGLGGRYTGGSLEGWYDLGNCWWVGGEFAYADLTLEVPRGSTLTDGFTAWRTTVGRWICTGENSLAARLDYTGSRLLDDEALANVVPLGRRFDFVTGALSAQRRLGMCWDAELEAFAGTDAGNPAFIWGFEGSLRRRVGSRLRVTLLGGFGNQARFQDGESGHVDVRFEWTP